ncbi:MAG: ATP-binding protein [Turneriella sp.]
MPEAKQGVIDLRSADLGNATYQLKGEWRFRWQEFAITQAQNPAQGQMPVYVRAPQAWNNFTHDGKKLGGHGYATYSLKVLLPEAKNSVALRMNEQGTAVRIFVNGKGVGGMGEVGIARGISVPETRPLTVLLTDNSTVLDIDVQISNFDYRKGGMWSGIFIASTDIVRGKVRKTLALDAFVAGCLLIIAAYHVAIFLFYRQGTAPLLFALFSLAMCMRLVSTGQRILPDIFAGIPFAVYSRLEFLSWFFIIPIGVHYAHAMFNNLRNNWFIPLNYLLAVGFSLLLIFPSTIYSYAVIPSQVVMLLSAGYTLVSLSSAVRRGTPGLRFFFFGAVVLVLVTINDVLYVNEVIRFAQLGPYGMLVFIFCHAIVVSRRLFIVFKEKEEAQNALHQHLVSRIEKSKSELMHERVASQATRQQFLNVVNNIPGITYRCAPEHPWTMYFLSDEVCRLTGYEAGDFIGNRVRTFASIIHPDDLSHVVASGRAKGERRYRLNYRIVCADSGIIWVEDSGQAVFDEAQNLVWLDGVMLDITARKNIESEILAAREKAESANVAKSHFLATVSHELRTPLHGVIGMTSVLKQTHLDAQQANYAAIIESSGQVLLALINDILDLAKIESGKIEIDNIAFDLHRHLHDIMEIIAVEARQKSILTSLTIAPDVPVMLNGDPARLRQILINLLGNAVKFTPKGGVNLAVHLERADDGRRSISFAVRDTGIGIPSTSVDMIFQPFRQADQSMTRKFGGTGLGLAISKQLAEILGGTITVKSNVGEGSEFTLKLPCVEAAADDKIKVTAAEEQDILRTRFAGQTVLLAEDDPVNQIVSGALLRNMNLKVEIAENGEELLRRLDEVKPDLILMDCMMPVMDGYQTTERIRERERLNNLAHMPVIALTANALRNDREKCLAAGMDDFIAKPFDTAQIIKMLRSWLPTESAVHE